MKELYIRLVCQNTGIDIDYSMYLDAPVNFSDGKGTIVTKASLFGYFGNSNDSLNPFILRKDKENTSPSMSYQIDFGTDFDEPDRDWRTNLPMKNIARNEQFTVLMFDWDTKTYKEHVYIIRQIIDRLVNKEI